jgi:GNAT superfamily N-acetyltransferase
MPSLIGIEVREARAADAGAAIEVVRDSITRLCVADHHNDSSLLGGWLENKTIDHFCAWLANPDNYCVVAEASSLCGVGLLHRSGDIRLLYVSPNTQRQGVGRALLHRLESQAHTWGLNRLQLSSTTVARAFYKSAGYRDRDERETWRGIVCYKYDRALLPIT